MRVTFLGTNGWYDTGTGNTVCTLVESKDYFLVLDAGNGIYKLDHHVPDRSTKPICLFLSHFHLDHIIGLHILNKFKFKQGLRIYGQPGTKAVLDSIIAQPYTLPLEKLSYKVDVHELSEGSHNLPFKVEAKFLQHASPCLGYRIELDGKTVAYCPDTGFCQNAIELARNADLLIAECAYKSGQADAGWPHLNPESASQVAREANAKKLALFHFDASRYTTLQDRARAQKEAQKTFGDTIAAEDGTTIEL